MGKVTGVTSEDTLKGNATPDLSARVLMFAALRSPGRSPATLRLLTGRKPRLMSMCRCSKSSDKGLRPQSASTAKHVGEDNSR